MWETAKKKMWHKKKCLHELCGDDKRKLASVSIFTSYQYGDKISNKIDEAKIKWRNEEYKKCKPIKFTIERVKKNGK